MFAAIRTLAAVAVLSMVPSFATAKDVAATVFLTDGHTLTADIDARSNDARLVLRFESDTATLLRHVTWDRVETIRIAGELLTADVAKAQLDHIVSARPEGIARDRATGQAVANAGLGVTHAEIAQHVLAN